MFNLVEFENKIGDLLASTTGLDRANVGVGYERYSRKRPSADVDWASLAVTGIDAPDYPIRDLVGEGRQAEVTVAVTLYGNNSLLFMTAFRDRLHTQASVDFLSDFKAGYREFGAIRRVPELINQQWFNRCDADVVISIFDYTDDVTQTVLGVKGVVYANEGDITTTQNFNVRGG